MINPSKKATIAIYSIGAVISFSSSYYLTGKAFDHYDIGKDHTVNTVIVRTVPIEKVIIKNNTPTTTTVDTVETYNPGQDSSANTGVTPTGIPEEGNDNTTGNGGNQQQNNSNNTGGNNQKRNTNGNSYPEENVNTPQRHNLIHHIKTLLIEEIATGEITPLINKETPLATMEIVLLLQIREITPKEMQLKEIVVVALLITTVE